MKFYQLLDVYAAHIHISLALHAFAFPKNTHDLLLQCSHFHTANMFRTHNLIFCSPCKNRYVLVILPYSVPPIHTFIIAHFFSKRKRFLRFTLQLSHILLNIFYFARYYVFLFLPFIIIYLPYYVGTLIMFMV